ncbi:hypothetical protein ACF09J_30455 [Streptomyces sp. NPDC014889]|uniref:hypothetical protein n=1 Tax=Streptomyces sp. NPDC014889 TaxID=3364928 RepID=UPI0036FBB3D6
MPEIRQLTIDGRCNGPDGSANGGYACGAFARLCPMPVAVTLHAPPRLDRPLRAEVGGRRAHLWDGDQLIATAAPTEHRVGHVDPVSSADAIQASGQYPGRLNHPFPRCFVCGPDRKPGEGLLLAPGPVPGRAATVACPWVPDATVTGENGRVLPEFVWSVLDCPSGWTADLVTAPKVLGWMRAELETLPTPGDQCVVVGRLDTYDDHGLASTSVLYDSRGTVLARATTRWFAP